MGWGVYLGRVTMSLKEKKSRGGYLIGSRLACDTEFSTSWIGCGTTAKSFNKLEKPQTKTRSKGFVNVVESVLPICIIYSRHNKIR